MDYSAPGTRGDLNALTVTTGAVVPFDQVAGGCTLTATTFYFPVGGIASPTPRETQLVSVHLKWPAAFAATITVETCNFPHTLGGTTGQGAVDVSDFDATAGNWIPSNPSTAIVDVVGTGNTATAATVTAGGTGAGGCMIDLGNFGMRRVRIKVVASVGGVVRCNAHGKAGA